MRISIYVLINFKIFIICIIFSYSLSECLTPNLNETKDDLSHVHFVAKIEDMNKENSEIKKFMIVPGPMNSKLVIVYVYTRIRERQN